MNNNTIFINSWERGTAENANIGTGSFVGIETYSNKGVARLTKDTTKVSASVVKDLPIYFTTESNDVLNPVMFSQGDTGRVYQSTDRGDTWTDITSGSVTPSAGLGQGLIYYQGYLFAFRGANIDYYVYNTATWTLGWKTDITAGVPHFPFINPNDGQLYFANANKVGLIGTVGTTTFNPAGTIGTDYIYTKGDSASEGSATVFGLILPSIYQVNCISFLPPNNLVLGTAPAITGSDPQVADIILWTPTLTTYNSPLRLFSQGAIASGGVTQIINRNNVIYAVTGGNHAVFSTNGSSFQLVEDVSLYTTSRYIADYNNTHGAQSTAPIFINQYPSAIAVQGNKLYTGVSSSVNSNPEFYGNYPLGIWSLAFADSVGMAEVLGQVSTQLEFTISTGTVCGNFFNIGALYPLSQGQLLIGWKDDKGLGVDSYGIDKTGFLNYQANYAEVQIESPMFEIGTPLNPDTIVNIQYNLPRNLLNGQEIHSYWRTRFDQDYTEFANSPFTASNSKNRSVYNDQEESFKILQNPINPTRYVQIKTSMSTGGNEGGTVTTNGTTTVVGSGTTFTNLVRGDYITVGSVTAAIASVTNDTHLTTQANMGNDGSGQSYYINLDWTPEIRNIIVSK
jgi:hypothetical protein